MRNYNFLKKFYSGILLATFLVGTLQPILPMIEYQLFEGDIMELLTSDICHSDDSCVVLQCVTNVDCPGCDENDDQQLLDTDFYPLALEITSMPSPGVFLIGVRFDLPIVDDVISPTILPNPPPPLLS